MNDDLSLYRNRIIVSLMLALAGFVDLIAWCLTEQRIAGFILNFIILGVLFALQNAFKIVRLLFICAILLWLLYNAFAFFVGPGIARLLQFVTSWFMNPSVRPLTLALGIIIFLTWRFASKYDFTKG